MRDLKAIESRLRYFLEYGTLAGCPERQLLIDCSEAIKLAQLGERVLEILRDTRDLEERQWEDGYEAFAPGAPLDATPLMRANGAFTDKERAIARAILLSICAKASARALGLLDGEEKP